MNTSEQRTHRTVTAALASGLEKLSEAATARMDSLDRRLGELSTHQVKLAHEQRAYVDNEDRQLRQCCQERWDDTAKTTKRLADGLYELRYRGFWSRLNWLLTGR
jgi:hypothetical protein